MRCRSTSTMAMRVLLFFGLIVFVASQNLLRGDYDRIDTNNDHSISASELTIYCLSLDDNGDGQLDYGEFSQAGTDGPDLKAQFTFYDNIGGVQDDHINCHDDARTFFGKLDTDDDGKVTLDEFTAEVDRVEEEYNGPPAGK